MKLLWTGSDTLFATRLLGGRKFPTKLSKYIYFLGCTIFAKIADKFVECHYVVSEHLISNLKPLKLKKPIKVLVDPPKDVKMLKRKPHVGFNILYYIPKANNQKFTNWVYGYDILLSAFRKLPLNVSWCNNQNPSTNGITVITVDGNAKMEEIYPVVDIMVRPNRSDGNPRMVMECEQMGIPYYWTKENPNINDLEWFITEQYEIQCKTQG